MSDGLRVAALDLGQDPYDLVLGQSDDYELIFTCPRGNVDRIRATIATVSDLLVTEVGQIETAAQGIRVVLPDGTTRSVTATGWDHFG